jgi:hypothetical protein
MPVAVFAGAAGPVRPAVVPCILPMGIVSARGESSLKVQRSNLATSLCDAKLIRINKWTYVFVFRAKESL